MRWLESPDLSAAIIGFFTMLAAIFGGGTIAQLFGSKGKPVAPPPAFAEVKGAIVDNAGVDRMVKSLDGFTAAAVLLTAAIDRDVDAKSKLTLSLNRNSEVSEDMRDEIKDTGTKLERLKDELIRAGVHK